MASHIVGGEFEIIHQTGYTYRVNLILYFDLKNGNPQANDPSVMARIFRKRDNAFMMDVFLPRVSQTPVDYTQPECSNGEVVTDKIVYTTTINLPPTQFNDPEGYYISWERCCRNYSITNIKSKDPAVSSDFAGQTFYLEFPPVVKNGEQFINSTPRLFPPLNDYGCPRKPYYVDFAGTDDDGDSLVYSLVTPLNTKSADAIPPGGPRPSPYPNVQWQSPFGPANVMGGMPDLKISEDGFITVTPQFQGLYVFAVKCEEFRGGEKIGEVRRDFQMLVVDVCPQAEPPQILGKKLTDANFSHDNTMSVSYANTVSDEDRCIQVQVSDPDASKQDDNFIEKVKIRAIPLNFKKKDVTGVLPDVTNATLVNGSTVTFDVCFPDCPFIDGPYQIGIVAYDDACSLPLSDTLKVTVNVEPPDNNNPYFITPDVTAAIQEGSGTHTWDIKARDGDNNPLILGVIPVGFQLEDAGMTFTIVQQEDGLVDATLEWDPLCNVYDFTQQTDFQIQVIVEDQDYCNFSHPALMTLNLHINLPSNADPIIYSEDLSPDKQARRIDGITKKVFETLTFTVVGEDLDNDFLVLDVQGKGFNISNYTMTFPQATGNGQVESTFSWTIGCADNLNLATKDEFELQFIVIDNQNYCRFFKADTLDVVIKIEPPDNLKPELLITSLNQQHALTDGTMTAHIGEQINLGLFGSDGDTQPDQDFIRIELIEATGDTQPEGYVFAPGEGIGTAQTTFSWNPECSIFSNGDYENNYSFVFRIFDNRCYNAMGDTIQVDMVISDVDEGGEEFIPPNFISPDGNGVNEFFAMVKYVEETGEFIDILPSDNCQGHFESIRIYNRWGRQVFESQQRDFRWIPHNEASGVYYYLLRFSNKEYRGSVTIRF